MAKPRDGAIATRGLDIKLDRVGMSFSAPAGRLVALNDLTMSVPAGSFTAIIGPNGCGKSTLLRIIAGLLGPDAGSVRLGDVATPRAGDGRAGMAFQQPRLVPWLTTLENVALPLTLAGGEDRLSRARGALAQVGIEEAAALRPWELSGGMAQRAALARSLVTDPPILLLDEPFSALDALTRDAFNTELERMWLDRPRTVLLVTHSVPEAIRMADRIAVMTARPGRVARMVEVDLPRPRPADLTGDSRAAEIAREVRGILASVHPPELAPWLARA